MSTWIDAKNTKENGGKKLHPIFFVHDSRCVFRIVRKLSRMYRSHEKQQRWNSSRRNRHDLTLQQPWNKELNYSKRISIFCGSRCVFWFVQKLSLSLILSRRDTVKATGTRYATTTETTLRWTTFRRDRFLQDKFALWNFLALDHAVFALRTLRVVLDVPLSYDVQECLPPTQNPNSPNVWCKYLFKIDIFTMWTSSNTT